MSYIIRFEGIGSTGVCARSWREAIEHGEMFERFGKTNIIVSVRSGKDVQLSEFRKMHQN